MSKLSLATRQATWSLNATQINSPIYGQLSTAQTKTMAMHFPVRCTQPEIQFQVVFPSENEYEQFQRFVRAHQQDALANLQLLTLNWPQRNINNWTGVIKSFQAGGKRFNFAPQATFSVDLVDSMVSQRVGLLKDVLNVASIYGVGMVGGVLTQPSANQPGIGSAAGTNGTLTGSSTSSPQINSSIPGLNTGIG